MSQFDIHVVIVIAEAVRKDHKLWNFDAGQIFEPTVIIQIDLTIWIQLKNLCAPSGRELVESCTSCRSTCCCYYI